MILTKFDARKSTYGYGYNYTYEYDYKYGAKRRGEGGQAAQTRALTGERARNTPPAA